MNLNEACDYGNKELAEELLKNGANIEETDSKLNTPLHQASNVGYPSIVKLLLKKGANKEATNLGGCTPLHLACIRELVDVVELLLESGANVEAICNDNKTPLHMASRGHFNRNVELLLEKSANVEAIDNNGKTPLHYACEAGMSMNVELLLEKGASVQEIDNNGKTPLHLACENGKKRAVDLLLIKGADIKAIDNNGRTPLHLAGFYGSKEIVELLLNKGADIKAIDFEGNIVLHTSCHSMGSYLVKFLIEQGADIVALNNKGESAIQLKPEYFNKRFLLPIFKKAIDEGNVKVLANLCKYKHYIEVLSESDPMDSPEDKAVLEKFSNFYAEYASLDQDGADKVDALNCITMQKLKAITTIPANNNQFIVKIIKFFTSDHKQGISQVVLSIDGVRDLIMSFVGWSKQWGSLPRLEDSLRLSTAYQSIEDIVTLIHSRSADIAIISNKHLDALQQIFQFDDEIKQSIVSKAPDVLTRIFAKYPHTQEQFERDPSKINQFIWLKLIAKTLSYDITYYSEADSIIHIYGGDNAVAGFKIYETPESHQLVAKIENTPKIMPQIRIEQTVVSKALVELKDSGNTPEIPGQTSFTKDDIANIVYKATIGLKALDTVVDTIKIFYEPTFKHANVLFRDVIHLGSIITGENNYVIAMSVGDILNQAYQGDQPQALIKAGIVAAGYILFPTMLGTSLSTLMLAYTGYKVADNIYSLYSNYGAPEAELKSNLAYANLAVNLGLQDNAKEYLAAAMQIVEKDLELYHDSDSTVQQLAIEYQLFGKVCELNLDYDHCNG